MRMLVICTVTSLLVVACSSAEQAATESGGTTVAAIPGQDTTTSIVEQDTTTSIVDTSDDGALLTTTSTAPEIEGPRFVEGLGMDVIVLKNPTSGGGDLPELAWDPVDDVDRYNVFVFKAQGDLYWSWSTSENAVFVGGIETDIPDAPGPRVLPGMTWAILGFDTSGALIAQSELRPISP